MQHDTVTIISSAGEFNSMAAILAGYPATVNVTVAGAVITIAGEGESPTVEERNLLVSDSQIEVSVTIKTAEETVVANGRLAAIRRGKFGVDYVIETRATYP